MKTKALSKRLTLNKETVSNLGNDQMKALHGGIYPTTTTAIPCQYSCDSCRVTFCTCGCTVSCNTECNSACSNACC